MDILKTLLERLQHEDDRLSALLDGKAHLVNINPSLLRDVITAQDLVLVFDCLDSSNEEQLTASLFILKMLLPLIDNEKKLQALLERLQKGINHSNGEVRRLCLKVFQDCCVSDNGNKTLLADKNSLQKVIELVADKDMSIALAASQVLSKFGSHSLMSAKTLLQGELLAKLLDVMAIDDTVRYRVYDVVVKIQSKSEDYLNVCVQSNLIQKLIDELNGADVLVRVICVATLSEMAFTKHSLHYLKRSGVVDSLVRMITNSSSDPLADLYMPEVVKFFGKMCYQDGAQNVIQLFPQFLPTLFGLMDDQDPVKKKIAIETVGFIGRTVEGKCVLSKTNDQILSAIAQMGLILRSEGSDLRLIAANAISQLLYITRTEQNEDMMGLMVRWFQSMSSAPVDDILALCRQPFTSVKCAGFHLVKTLADLEWGLTALVEFPTFTEFILDRAGDSNKESKDARFEAVKAIAESPHCMHVFGNNNYLKFRAYVNEGPLYQEEISPAVAMESG